VQSPRQTPWDTIATADANAVLPTMNLLQRCWRAMLMASLAATALAAEPSTDATTGATASTAVDQSNATAAVKILQETCNRCHGPLRQKGHLRLDSRAAMLSGGEGGPAIFPGNPDKSPMIVAVRYQNEDFQMPPDKPIEDAQVATLVAWVKAGAPWPAPVSASATHAATAATIADQDADTSSGGTHTRPPLIGRVHPLVVHFPIACLLLAALAEALHFLVAWRQRGAGKAAAPTGWENAVAFLILTGAAGAVAAVTTGTFFPDDGSQMFHRTDPTMRTHELLGWLSMLFAVSAAGYLFLSGPNASRWPLRFLLIAAAAVVGLTGHLGGAMVYGEHFLF